MSSGAQLPETREHLLSAAPAGPTTAPCVRCEFTLPAGQIHVWSADLDSIIAGALVNQTLSPDEIGRAARFRLYRGRHRYECRRFLLRVLLSRYLDIPPAAVRLRYGPHGKPELTGSNKLQFNLSHSEGRALFAFSLATIGVDLQRIHPDQVIDPISTLTFSARERNYLEGLPPSERVIAFFRGWTRKEACLKALGRGLSVPLNSFEVSLASEAAISVVVSPPAALQPERWVLLDVAAYPGFAACVAVPEPCCKVNLRRIDCDSGIIGS